MNTYFKRMMPILVVLALCLGLAAVLVGRTAAMPQVNVVGIGGDACGYATIGEAILAAAGEDTIYLSAGTYNEVLGTLDKDLHFTAATADCTAADPDAAPFDYVIDGGGAPTFQGGIVNVAPGRTVTFTNMYLQNAEAIRGGIVYLDSGATATFNRVRLRNGSADDVGGILYVADNASLFVNGTTFVQDGSAGNAGGALYLAGEAHFSYGVMVQSSQAPIGGGVAMVGAGHLILYASHIGDGLYPNTAERGGGIHMTDQSWLEIHSTSTIRWNNATIDHGGGVYAEGNVTIEMDGGRIYGNEAVAAGGGIYAVNGVTISLNDYSMIGDTNPDWGNQADWGGGIFADSIEAVKIFDEAKVQNNRAVSAGGGIYLEHDTLLNMEGGYILANQTDGWGGGIAVNLGQVNLEGTVVSGNQAARGGGISLENSSNNELTATNSQILSNTATLDGGGIYSQFANVTFLDTDGTSRLAANQAGLDGGALATSGSPEVIFLANLPGSQVRIEGNTAGGNGGGLYGENQGNIYLAGNTWLAANTALGNGGGWYQDSGQMMAMGLTQSQGPQVSGNTAANGQGGGLYLDGVSLGLLLNVSIAGNQADSDGGGLYVTNGSPVQLLNALVHDNQAGLDGGGLQVSAATVGIGMETEFCQPNVLPANHYCSEFRDNSATGNGGAVGLELAAEVIISNTAVISNSASLGSGLMSASNGDHIEITNSLFSHNSGKTIYLAADATMDLVHTTLADNEWAIDINDNGASPDLQDNIVWGNGFGVETEVLLAPGCSISQNGVGGVNSDPLFQTTGRGDYRLQAGSPAVDGCNLGAGSDMDGVPRPQGADFDAGAFEAGRPLLIFPALVTVGEGDSGVSQVPLVIALSEAADEEVTVEAQVVGTGATAGVDFNPISLTLTFPVGVISQTVPLGIIGDTLYEGDEQLELQLSNAVGAELIGTTAVVVIDDNETLPALSVAGTSVVEGDSGATPLNLVVSLSHPSAYTITVSYFTGDEDTTADGEDYQDTSGTLTIAPGEETAEITVFIYGDEIQEANEQFLVTLYAAAGATLLPGGEEAWVTILNDDGVMNIYLPAVVNK